MKDVQGLTFRHPREDDLPNAAAVLSAEEYGVRGHVTYGPEELRDWWRLYDLAEGSWLVENEDGEPVGISGLLARGGEFSAWIAVDPRYNGRVISSELIARAERRVRELGGDHLRVGALAENDRARELLTVLGFREIRRFFRMQADFTEPPAAPRAIEGIRIATFRPEDARAFHAALGDAMADDWGFATMSYDEWKKLRLDRGDNDTSLWFLAWDDSEIAGAIRCDGQKFGGGFGGALGVRRPWRGRGIGMALLQQAFAAYYERSVSRVTLGVDSEN